MRKRTISTAILCADLHIRANVPISRTDDFLNAQWEKLNFIFALCEENKCPLLIAGDVGDKPQWPNWLLEKVMSIINQYKIDIFCILGQHDLPEHRLDYWQKSGCGVLDRSGSISIVQERSVSDGIFDLYPFSYGVEIVEPEISKLPTVAMVHQMVVEKKDLWPGQQAPKGHELLKKFTGYDLILSGDNHGPFVSEYENRLLVNPGSMMRSTAAQIDHRPRVYKWYAETNEVEAVYLPIEQNVIDRTHIEVKQERDKRMEACVTRMSDNFEIGLSFENNLEEYFRTNRTQKNVTDKIWRAVTP